MKNSEKIHENNFKQLQKQYWLLKQINKMQERLIKELELEISELKGEKKTEHKFIRKLSDINDINRLTQ